MTAAAEARQGPSLRGRGLRAASWMLCRLPERPLLAIADLMGVAWYRLAPERRRRARRNLTRVVRYLSSAGLASPRVQAAARNPGALNDLLRDAFRHSARYYVQLLRAPVVTPAYLRRWLAIDTPEEIDAALNEPTGSLFVGLHIGLSELPALYLSLRSGKRAVVPVEVVGDPDVQAFMTETRERMGVRLVELGSARRLLVEALGRGEPVGLLGDRDITGGGIEVPFFGARAPLPAGPALLALETGVVPHVFGVWRDARGVYHARAQPVPMRPDGTRRQRVTGYLEDEAKVFERWISLAPEQWLAVFHPIWPDLEANA
jgi:lauroyl/myristoyl acyltransferase